MQLKLLEQLDPIHRPRAWSRLPIPQFVANIGVEYSGPMIPARRCDIEQSFGFPQRAFAKPLCELIGLDHDVIQHGRRSTHASKIQ
jgi:hypothetical protein